MTLFLEISGVIFWLNVLVVLGFFLATLPIVRRKARRAHQRRMQEASVAIRRYQETLGWKPEGSA